MINEEILQKIVDIKADLTTVKTDVSKITQLDERISRIETSLKDIETVKADVASNKQTCETLKTDFEGLRKKVDAMTTVRDEYKKEIKRLAVQKSIHELLSKRWNIIIHGIPHDTNADGTTKWESRHDACLKVKQFFSTVLKMNDDQINSIVITDALFVVMEHLPEQMQNDRKSLLSVLKDAKTQDSTVKCVWFADRVSGEYCLKIGNVIHKPTRDANK